MSSGPRRRRLALRERGIELALLEWDGPGPLALLAHANGFCAALWSEVAERLRSAYRVVAYDARGHGDSSKPVPPEPYAWSEFALDLLALAAALRAEPGAPAAGIYGIGHSFGGTATLVAAAERPDLFGRIALVDAVLLPPLRERPRESTSRLVESARRRRAVWPSRDALRESWRERPLFASWTPAAFELYVREGTRERADGSVELKCPPEIEAAVFENGGFSEIEAATAALRVPGLLLQAARSDFPHGVAESLCRRSAHLRLESIDASHLVPMEVPDELALRLLAFGTE